MIWTFPGGTVDLYIVQYVLAMHGLDSSDVTNITVSGIETSVAIGNLLPLATYEFRIAVMNGMGISSFNDLNSFTTKCELLAIIDKKNR